MGDDAGFFEEVIGYFGPTNLPGGVCGVWDEFDLYKFSLKNDENLVNYYLKRIFFYVPKRLLLSFFNVLALPKLSSRGLAERTRSSRDASGRSPFVSTASVEVIRAR